MRKFLNNNNEGEWGELALEKMFMKGNGRLAFLEMLKGEFGMGEMKGEKSKPAGQWIEGNGHKNVEGGRLCGILKMNEWLFAFSSEAEEMKMEREEKSYN